MEEQALLEAIRSEYWRLDRLLGISTEQIPLSFSTRMVRQYGVCCFRADRPTAIRLAAFLKDEPEQLRQTALHEYAHAAAALLTGRGTGMTPCGKASACASAAARSGSRSPAPQRRSAPPPMKKAAPEARSILSAALAAGRRAVTCGAERSYSCWSSIQKREAASAKNAAGAAFP